MGFFDSILGNDAADAANAAAADQYAKQQKAVKELKAFGDQYQSGFAGLSKSFDPYVQSGQSALQRLLQGLGLGGEGGQQEFTNAYRGLPGYQAGLDAGGQAVAGNANAGNMLQSGRAMKALQRFGSDYEDQRSGSYLDRLMGLQQQGQSAVGSQVNTVGTGMQGNLGARTSAFGGQMQSAPTIGQGMVAGAQSQQNALTNLMAMGTYLAGAGMGKLPGLGGGGGGSSFGITGVGPYG